MNKKQLDEQKAYQQRVKEQMPKSRIVRNCIWAFVFGGIICTIGQAVTDFGKGTLQLDKEGTAAFASIVMIFLGATLTGLGVYDQIGKVAGAGSIVPITGFANSIVAPAMEFKREGYIMGVGAKMFILAGPVLVYGIFSSVLYGLIWLAFQ